MARYFLVTNDLLPQKRYSIRGLLPETGYDLKVTAHNHAGSTSIGYTYYYHKAMFMPQSRREPYGFPPHTQLSRPDNLRAILRRLSARQREADASRRGRAGPLD